MKWLPTSQVKQWADLEQKHLTRWTWHIHFGGLAIGFDWQRYPDTYGY